MGKRWDTICDTIASIIMLPFALAPLAIVAILCIIPVQSILLLRKVIIDHMLVGDNIPLYLTFAGIILIIVIIACCIICNYKNGLKKIYDDKLAKLDEDRKLLERDVEIFNDTCVKEKQALKKKEDEIRALLLTKSPFKYASKIATDMEMWIFRDSATYLRNKRRPAHVAAQEVAAMKKISAAISLRSKELEYKHEYIMSAFPEIAEYVENDEDLLSVGERFTYNEIEDQRDRRKDYLSDDEYRQLSDTEKSQLALDRYVNKRKKSKWDIGRDYEMSCAFQMRSRGYTVEMHGIKYKNEDLGRDLIAIKDINSEILIIQCKNWSAQRPIRENVVMQLYGTAIEFSISSNLHVDPVLMIPPYSILSDMAIKFAAKLRVRIERMPNLDFPRIKCNINKGNQIYHLPFDQQYDRTEIELPGEFYAYTVKEAEQHGFRRAMRHQYTNM